MLTPRQNVIECMRGGNPERIVNQFDFVQSLRNPFFAKNPSPRKGQLNVVNAWGVTRSFPDNTPGPFPVHNPDTIVIKDITHWRDYVHAPSLKFSDAEWEPFEEAAAAVDRTQKFASASIMPGIFEQCHYLGELQNTLMNFYEEPEAMHELIEYLTDWELELAEQVCSRLHPDMMFHHDDWGSRTSTFMSPDMFAEFFLEPYKKVYGYYKDHGVELIMHHSDSYAATLVPYMIEMGIDIWQGVMRSNDIPGLRAKYGNKITFMGGVDAADVDYEGVTYDVVEKWVNLCCDENGPKNFIPCGFGGAGSTFPGVYQMFSDAVDAYNQKHYPVK